MGQVAFWGSAHGQVGTTANVIATSALIGLEVSLRTLVAHTHWSRSTLETAFLKNEIYEDSLVNFSDTGIDALERLARSGRLSPDIIRDYTKPVLRERLDLLVGTSKPDEALFWNLNEVIQSIFATANQFYNLTLLDVNSGSQNALTNTVLASSDLIIVNLNQNLSLLERFFSKEDWPDELNDKKFLLVLGQYDPDSKYTAANIARRFRYKDPIYTVPYCSGFRDACNDRNVVDFFLRNRQAGKGQENHFFFQEIRKLTKAMLDHLSIDMEEEE
jgi:hypothetical protein